MSKVIQMSKEHYEQMYALGLYAFNTEDTSERKQRFFQLFEHSWNYGIFDGEQLSSQIMATPFTVNCGHTRFQMAGIGCVSSYPEYRGQGSINQIMEVLLKDIDQKGINLSYLAPFSYPFYRRYGFEYVFEKTIYEIRTDEWPKVAKPSGKIVRCRWDAAKEQIQQVYNLMPEHQYGSLVREDWWLESKFLQKFDYHYALYLNEVGEAEGYLVYRGAGSAFDIYEWGYLTTEAFWGLAYYIGAHNSSFDTIHYETGNSDGNLNYLFATPAAEVTVKPEMMAKIVNVQRFLSDFSFEKGADRLNFQLIVTEDKYCQWNEGIYWVQVDEAGKTTAEKTDTLIEEVPVVEGDIQGITQLLLSFRPARELVFFRKVRCEEELAVRLEERLARHTPVLEDYF